jgi:hypothetical protein
MSNVPQEAGNVATSVVDAMRAQPICLALLVGWVMTLGFSYLAPCSASATGRMRKPCRSSIAAFR